MGFEQATIPIEKEREFQRLRGAIDQVFTTPLDAKFLRAVKGEGINIRQFERILQAGLIEKICPQAGSAQALYGALSVTDQAQVREYYLERLEKISPELRQKYSSIYRTF